MKKHSTCQKDKSIEKGDYHYLKYLLNYIILYLIFYIVILPFVFNSFLLYLRGFSSGLPSEFFRFVQVAMPYGPGLGTWRASWDQDRPPSLLESHVSRWVWLSKAFPNGSSAPKLDVAVKRPRSVSCRLVTNMGFSLERQNLSWSEGASIFRQTDNVGYILSLIWFHGSNSSSFGSLAQERPQARGDWGGEVRSHQRKNGWYIQNKQNHVGKTMP